MKLKYRNKLYSSDDVPIFLYFRNKENRAEFANLLVQYTKLGEYIVFPCLHSALAGNTIIRDKRSSIYLCIEDAEEKRIIQKSLFDTSEVDSNAVICTPADITEEHLTAWIRKHFDDFK